MLTLNTCHIRRRPKSAAAAAVCAESVRRRRDRPASARRTLRPDEVRQSAGRHNLSELQRSDRHRRRLRERFAHLADLRPTHGLLVSYFVLLMIL